MKEKDEACCMAPQPAEKTELQRALDEVVDAEKALAVAKKSEKIAAALSVATLNVERDAYDRTQSAKRRATQAAEALHAVIYASLL